VDGFISIEILPRDTPPFFDYTRKVPGFYAFHFAIGTLSPNFPQTLKPYWISRDWGMGPDPTVPTPGLLNPRINKDIVAGDWYVATHGRFTYDDVFGNHHWIKFCNSNESRKTSGEGAKSCAQYNDAD